MQKAPEIDVAIAGGGPGGLAAAAAINRALPDCRVQARPLCMVTVQSKLCTFIAVNLTGAYALQVFEAAPSYTPQGAGVLINLNGQNALEAIDPELFNRYNS